MATVASASAMHDQEAEQESKAESSPFRFTAVNGRENVTSGAAISTTSTRRLSTHENQAAEGPVSICSPKIGADCVSRYDETKENSGYAERDNMERSQDDQRSGRTLSSPEPLGRSKRKRSESREERRGNGASHKVLKSPDPRLDDSIASSIQRSPPNGAVTSQGESDAKQTPVQSRLDENGDARITSGNTVWHEIDSHLVKQAQRVQHLDASDAQLAEALQREANGNDLSPKGWNTNDRPIEGSSQSEQATSVPSISQERPHPAVQVAPKRKRVFSNRTKTGCMTCRRRKKKCDEQHPACNNCIRGGFLCEGYSSRSTWQKPSSAKPPVPLQSKEGYSDMNSQYLHDIGPPHERPQILTEHIEATKMRPIVVEDADRSTSQFSTSPTGVSSGRGWTKRAWGGSGHPAYIPDHLTKSDYREVPSIHELSREGHSKSDYAMVPPIRELSHGNHSKSSASLFQSGVDQRPAHSSNLDTSSPQAQARMALSIEHQLSARTVSGEETEREKMIRGELYRPYDVHLVEERDRCKAALWRFNNACNPLSGLSTKEQMRLLKEVFIPPVSVSSSPSGAPAPRSSGTIGQGAVVEAPFHCHYGYNVHLGEDVMISEGCLFVDDCPITIGAHTWIGPRVTILSSTAHANMQERKGSQSRYQGRSVAIEEDCYVGAGCTIYPGVRLRRGAYVAPGEVVKSDIVAYGFQGLKPGYM
ncbi:acetyltransferase [Aspergillus saccharolyticus JOP 1030-1]|uniref:Acetyltransferase n=1 Tax=Aspergillus saccharolyticus JOP 1030-1 TaxID=1450539 RepID=A0A318ZTS3_9EURO|nr:acetyltransferase [Aspergillus saccharolyticus JOP 1030-1]PYH47703.1 acetyltransferase [Aspergillus saccharolyticus JOP 1030-1]